MLKNHGGVEDRNQKKDCYCYYYVWLQLQFCWQQWILSFLKVCLYIHVLYIYSNNLFMNVRICNDFKTSKTNIHQYQLTFIFSFSIETNSLRLCAYIIKREVYNCAYVISIKMQLYNTISDLIDYVTITLKLQFYTDYQLYNYRFTINTALLDIKCSQLCLLNKD